MSDTNENLSNLDADQCIKRAFDPLTDRLRVDTEATINLSGNLEVNLDNSDDDVLVYGNDGTINRKIKTDTSGKLQINAELTTATPTRITASITTVTILASNANRRTARVTNDSTYGTMYLHYGASASNILYTVKLLPQSYYEFDLPIYTGLVTGISSRVDGADSYQVSEGT